MTTPDAPLVLLVDEIPDHIHIYRDALRKAGYEVALATSGAEALARVRAQPHDCVVIDVRLSDMSAWELCREVKSEADGRSPRVVMLVQNVTADAARDGAASGCTAWLARPSVADELVRAVDHVLAQETNRPVDADAALLGVTTCPGCASNDIRGGLRVGVVQYYVCKTCGLNWRLEASDVAT